jgi:hypothetical protein
MAINKMMTHKYIQYTMFLLMVNNWLSLSARTAQRPADMPDHFYLEWSGRSTDDSIQLSVGTFDWKNKLPVRNQNASNNLDSVLVNIEETLQRLPAEKSNILIHIHGLWANRKPFLEEITASLDEHIYADPTCPYGLIINVIWDSGYLYDRNRDVAYYKGQKTAGIVEHIKEITNRNKCTLSILCHSMGNRVLQGIVDSLDLDHRESPVFKKCIMAAPDIETDVFEVGKSFEKSEKIAESIVIYRHNTDRTLGMSKLINTPRLGLNGISGTANDFANIRLVDASLLNDEEFPSARLSRHRYYYTSPTVRQDMLAELSDIPTDKILNRSPLNRKNHFKLLFD